MEFIGRHPALRRGLVALIVLIVFDAAWLELRATHLYQEARQWPRTYAVIVSSRVTTSRRSWGRSPRFCAEFDYKYSIAGHSYTGHNSAFDFECWPEGYSFVPQHPQGTAIEIAYDPSDPSVTIVPASVQDPGYPWGDAAIGGLFLMVLLADLFPRRKEP